MRIRHGAIIQYRPTKQNPESGIHEIFAIRIRKQVNWNPESTLIWNPASNTAWNPEFTCESILKTVC